MNEKREGCYFKEKIDFSVTVIKTQLYVSIDANQEKSVLKNRLYTKFITSGLMCKF